MGELQSVSMTTPGRDIIHINSGKWKCTAGSFSCARARAHTHTHTHTHTHSYVPCTTNVSEKLPDTQAISYIFTQHHLRYESSKIF
jgi:hypothetical protein